MNNASKTLLTLGAALALNLAPTLAGLDLATAATVTHAARKSHQGEGPYVPPPAPEVVTTTTTTSTAAAPATPLPPPPPTPPGPTQQAQAMVGCWTGTAFQHAVGQEESWLIDRRADGTFRITFWAMDDQDEDADAGNDGGMVTNSYSYAEPAEDEDPDMDPGMGPGTPPHAGSVFSFEGQTEAGQWSLDDGLETLVTTSINGVPQSGAARDVYQINRFTGQEIDYTHLATGQRFSTHRVACGYQPPGMDAAPNPAATGPLPPPVTGS